MTLDCTYLACLIGWVLIIIIGVIGGAIIYLVVTGKIDLKGILIDPTTGKASLSRLQFLIFTFVIAFCLFLVVVGDGKAAPQFHEIPPGIFALLGISGATFAVSKGVDANKKIESEKTNVEMAKIDPTKADDMKLQKGV